MQDMDPQSTRAQFTQVTTPGELAPMQVSKVNHLPSPSIAMELDTPRTVEVVAGDGIPTGAWAAGLFDCFDNLMPNCFMVTFCPCVALAQLSTRLGIASYRVVLSLLLFVIVVELTMFTLVWTTGEHDDDSSDEYYSYRWTHLHDSDDKVVNVTFVIITLIVQMLLFVYIWQLRVKTRTRFQLPGNAVTDCLSSWFCSCCTVAQLRTHVRCYQPGDCSFGAPDVLQAYPGKSYAV
ncbi:hypothetical protein F441_03555 [Phytophthora nicotianae CJ01A1]|uniref:PLAC8 family protein n=5 Tax=Phytophthora nicotianae TaxID=4792 RepID=V9FPX3_PHYNI|nr:hypothetical protein F443_03561 [Phytophthora nicotianae P1569]ETK93364.1 hypothetical protein L915_03449 [Phytophthora nicotianae]ETO82195.1 hypothetical protein F444_03634 [Phytophthora nicotianae P1976]ETP23282.1 hypothetical protein F441_03555 [Phytophthora nicotianae CJ01A1]ETP51321.1 hypothetical protein F442_03541 [Phytophthora nicotianae P10297]